MKKILRKTLVEAGMSAYERKLTYEKIYETIYDKEEDSFVEEIIIFDYVILFDYDKEVDDEVEEDEVYKDPLDSVEILRIEKYDVIELLTSYGIDFEKSTSESVYFEVDGKEYRLSTHKRPAYQDESGIWHEWDYENQIICENEIEMYKEIKNILEVLK